MAIEKEPMAEAKTEAPGAAGQPQGAAEGPGGTVSIPGGLAQFLIKFMKSNPDIAREISTRMNAVIHGQQLQGLKAQEMAGDVVPSGFSQRIHDIQKSTAPTAPQPGVPSGQVLPIKPPGPQRLGEAAPLQQMAGDVIPLAGEQSMGPPVYQPADAAAPFAAGLQTAPNVQSIGAPTLKEWLSNYRARQG